MRRVFAACALVLLAAACAAPAQRYAQAARDDGFTRIVLPGSGFRHVAFVAGLDAGTDVLHVYVEHDGTPWLDSTHVATDPTPRAPLALALMARDTGPRLLLGRPCYFEVVHDAGCDAMLWTHHRYAPEVVASMVAALRAFLASHAFPRVILIGFSGGGTLAWLMAEHLPETVAVVTLAANLDTDDWTRLHGYSYMAGSLNPAKQPSLPRGIREVHYVGERDENVPPSLARAFLTRHPEATIVELPQFDHRCCWVERWPALLDDAMNTTPSARPE
ncbi:MAG: alpha/beta fold hydrolase [Rudaea sp.]